MTPINARPCVKVSRQASVDFRSGLYKAQAIQFAPDTELANWLTAETDNYDMLVGLYISILEEDGPMTLFGLQQLAELIGIKNPKDMLLQANLVSAIQAATGHDACFRSKASRLCKKIECKWKAESRTLISAWFNAFY